MILIFIRKVLEPFFTVFCPTLACCLIGLAAYGTQVFSPQSPYFQYVATGFVVGGFVLIAKRLTLMQFVCFTVLMTAVVIFGMGAFTPRLLVLVFVLMGALASAVVVNVKIMPMLPQVLVIGKFIAWSLVFVLWYFLLGVIPLIVYRPVNTVPYLLILAKLSVLTGIGLGIGFKTEDWLSSQLDVRSSQHAAGPDRRETASGQ